MQILEVTTQNLNAIAEAMANGVSLEELEDIIKSNEQKGRRPKYFLQVEESWAFVNRENFEPLIYSLLHLIDRY